MNHYKYLLGYALAASVSMTQEVHAQPPDKAAAPTHTLAEWQAQERERQAQERHTPLGTLWQFTIALYANDLVLAAKSVEAGRADGDLRRLQAVLEKAPRGWTMNLSALGAEAPQGKDEFEARVAVSLLNEGPLSEDAALKSKTTFIERLSMRRGKDGEWKIVPRPAPPAPAPPADESAQAQAQAIEAAVRSGQDEADGFLNTWARHMAAPREMLSYSVARASMNNVKQMGLYMLELAIDNDETYAFTAANFAEKLQPYAKSQDIFTAPTLDEAKGFGYTVNASLAGKHMADLDAVAQTPAIYEAGPDGKLLFRFGGKALIGFADGHVALVTPEDAEKLVWKVQAGPKASG